MSASSDALWRISVSQVVTEQFRPTTQSRQRAGSQSVRLPLYDTPSKRARSQSPDSRAYRSRPHPTRRRDPRRYCRFFSLISFRKLVSISRYLIPSLILWILFLWWTYEFYFELYVYRREWASREIKTVEPLSGCFDSHRVSPAYNVTERVYGLKRHHIQSGIPLRIGMDCFNFAGTIRNPPGTPRPEHRAYYHTYWRTDLVHFGERQEWTLKSFFATQDLSYSKLILWSDGDLSSNPFIERWLRRFPDAFETRTIDIDGWAKGTALEGSPMLRVTDDRAWVDGDLVRLLVTYAHGGVWLDMDSLLTRDLAPLLEHEFVTQWDCYERIYQALNGALMHFHKHSPYLCEAFHIMAHGAPPRAGTVDWGSDLYLKLWRRLVAAAVPPFQVLPFCFSDGGLCRPDTRMPDPLKPDPRSWGGGKSVKPGGELDDAVSKVFAIHLHNRWDKVFPKGGWVERLLLNMYEHKLPYIKTGTAVREVHEPKPEQHGELVDHDHDAHPEAHDELAGGAATVRVAAPGGAPNVQRVFPVARTGPKRGDGSGRATGAEADAAAWPQRTQ